MTDERAPLDLDEVRSRLDFARGPCCRVLADRERELLDIKGPCGNAECRLHYAHSGPCDIRTQP